jgi:hypothetical protein
VAERIRRAHATLGVVHKALLEKVDEIPIGALQQLRDVLDLRAALLVMGVLWQWVALGICECYVYYCYNDRRVAYAFAWQFCGKVLCPQDIIAAQK